MTSIYEDLGDRHQHESVRVSQMDQEGLGQVSSGICICRTEAIPRGFLLLLCDLRGARSFVELGFPRDRKAGPVTEGIKVEG